MKIYAGGDGQLAGWWQGVPPEPVYLGVVETLEIDGGTNAALVEDIEIHPDAYTLAGGVLSRNGAPVVVAAHSAAYTERQQALTLTRGLKQYNDRANPTTAQTVAAVKANNRLTLILGRVLLREIEGE